MCSIVIYVAAIITITSVAAIITHHQCCRYHHHHQYHIHTICASHPGKSSDCSEIMVVWIKEMIFCGQTIPSHCHYCA